MSRPAAARIEQPEAPTVRRIDPEISEVMNLIGAMERLANEMSAARGEFAAEEAAATAAETSAPQDTQPVESGETSAED